jgi:hypothetical protein
VPGSSDLALLSEGGASSKTQAGSLVQQASNVSSLSVLSGPATSGGGGDSSQAPAAAAAAASGAAEGVRGATAAGVTGKGRGAGKKSNATCRRLVFGGAAADADM